MSNSLPPGEPSITTPSSPTVTTTAIERTSTAQAQTTKAKISKKASNAPSELKIKKLPSVEELRNMIPSDGVDIRDLARKLNISDTNYWLFSELIKMTCDIEIRAWVRPLPTIPSPFALMKLYQAASKPAVRRELLENQVIAAELQGDITITWEGHTELARGASRILPESFYRVFYEDSATLTPYVSKHTHPKHRGRLGFTMSDKVAFQSIGTFSVSEDFTRDRIERQLVWNQKKNPSSFVSASDSINVAKRRAHFHSPDGKSNRIGVRIAIARISTHGLRPVTIHADLKETIQNIGKDEFGLDTLEDLSTEIRPVQIPAWIHEDALSGYHDATSMTLEELEAAEPEIWLSITELRHCNLKVPATRGHDYE
ncbi:hypothetical protein PMIN04_010574 [Paraphaeosphaeria minitans]|uniref:Uncharacterized protein n=1 Tax=Paraphaeosphaeria minitans TaxID=565426 RepID=A0A9P6G6C9_9PLEO|nr:hypothetical protein PMIN01_12551 [Paraphaeosphaeria minitans]